MPNYVEITATEFDAFIASLKTAPSYVSGNPTREKYYDWDLRRSQPDGVHLAVRVYTSIVPQDGRGRDVGRDAIRVCLVRDQRTKRERIVWSHRRVHRTPDWQTRVKDRMIDAWRLVRGKQAKCCPACGAPMVPRHRKNDKNKWFWSCVRFPLCKGIKGAKATSLDEALAIVQPS